MVNNSDDDEYYIMTKQEVKRFLKFALRVYKKLNIPLIHARRLANSGYPYQNIDYVLVKNPYVTGPRKYFPVDYLLTNIVKALYKNGINAAGWDQGGSYCGKNSFIFVNHHNVISKLKKILGKDNIILDKEDKEYKKNRITLGKLYNKRRNFIKTDNLKELKKVKKKIELLTKKQKRLKQKLTKKQEKIILKSKKIHLSYYAPWDKTQGINMNFSQSLIPHIHKLLKVKMSKKRYPGLLTMSKNVNPIPKWIKDKGY